jgi:hypothetical protein
MVGKDLLVFGEISNESIIQQKYHTFIKMWYLRCWLPKSACGYRTTQVWDAKVTEETGGKTIALFRCTQLILYRSRE